ncbi:uncharacterized protein LOC143018147 [Oratosquilla oratoria]|uniref:uncharacterized protein LOC143018147 n=1 Tax=Oratosquilla oratoria TaxID=337810 RepID=UPI003F76130F
MKLFALLVLACVATAAYGWGFTTSSLLGQYKDLMWYSGCYGEDTLKYWVDTNREAGKACSEKITASTKTHDSIYVTTDSQKVEQRITENVEFYICVLEEIGILNEDGTWDEDNVDVLMKKAVPDEEQRGVLMDMIDECTAISKNVGKQAIHPLVQKYGAMVHAMQCMVRTEPIICLKRDLTNNAQRYGLDPEKDKGLIELVTVFGDANSDPIFI